MGTKNNPGKFDCYSKAEPDEPMFVLLARDPIACLLVPLWISTAQRLGKNPEKIEEADSNWDAMRIYAEKLHTKEELNAVTEALLATLRDCLKNVAP